MAESADDLLGLMDQVMAAWVALDHAHQQAQAAGRIERAISLNLVLRSVGDGALAMAELLESEGTPYQPPDGGGPKGGHRLRAVRRFGYPWREALLSPLASCCYSSFSGTRVGAPYVDAQRPGKAESTPLLKPVSMYTTPVAVTHNTATRHCPGAGYSALSAEAL